MIISNIFIAALIAVESGGDAKAIGDNGRSVGVLQIQRAVVEDVNRVHGTRYRWPEDAQNPMNAARICRLYLQHWCTVDRLRREPTLEDAARIWNGGPHGYKKPATEKYWLRVKRELQRLERKQQVMDDTDAVRADIGHDTLLRCAEWHRAFAHLSGDNAFMHLAFADACRKAGGAA